MASTFVAAAVWMMRAGMQQQKTMSERFILHLERTLEQQQGENRLNRAALKVLTGAVRRNTQLLNALARQGERNGA